MKNEDAEGEGMPFILGSESTGNGILNVDGTGTLFTAEVRQKGKVSATGASVFLGTQSNGDGTIMVGGSTDRRFDFAGRIDEVAIYGRALTPDEEFSRFPRSKK